jgi:hypothetical protein
MNIGVRQKMVLLHCKKFGHVTLTDVRRIFNMSTDVRNRWSDGKRKLERPLLEMEKLVTYGFLEKDAMFFHWTLTDAGKRIVDE